jgi:hypothetical protein
MPLTDERIAELVYSHDLGMANTLSRAIRIAVAEAEEQCAKICDQYEPASFCAKLIREMEGEKNAADR